MVEVPVMRMPRGDCCAGIAYEGVGAGACACCCCARCMADAWAACCAALPTCMRSGGLAQNSATTSWITCPKLLCIVQFRSFSCPTTRKYPSLDSHGCVHRVNSWTTGGEDGKSGPIPMRMVMMVLSLSWRPIWKAEDPGCCGVGTSRTTGLCFLSSAICWSRLVGEEVECDVRMGRVRSGNGGVWCGGERWGREVGEEGRKIGEYMKGRGVRAGEG